MDMADRLVECQYELTDGLAFYLCNRRPGNILRILQNCNCYRSYFDGKTILLITVEFLV